MKNKFVLWLPAMILICYLSMSFLRTLAELGWNNALPETGMYDWFTMTKQLLQCLFSGILLYVLPYEWVMYHVRYFFAEGFYLFEVKETIQTAVKMVLPALIYVLLTVMLWIEVPPYPRISYYDMMTLVLTILLVIMMLYLFDMIENKWICSGTTLLLLCIHAVVATHISGKFVLAVVLTIAELIVWSISVILNKKGDGKIAFATFVTVALFFIKLAEWTGREFQIDMLCKGFSLCKGSMFLELKNEYGKVSNLSKGTDYGYTMIYDTFGRTGLTAFFVFFVLLSIVALYGSWKLYGLSKKRGMLVLTIYLMFACTIAYGVLQELGIVPISALYIMKNELNIPMLFLAFRMFDIRPTKEICLPDYLDWDEEHFL